MQFVNPYKNVDWTKQHKANFHTHTVQQMIDGVKYGSDGAITGDAVIDYYYNAGYKILAITDHDYAADGQTTTYPWEIFGRNPEQLGMLDVQGKELSYGHHICSLFCDLGRATADVWTSVAEIKSRGGLCIVNHPSRYEEALSFYTYLFELQRDTLVGIEAFNSNRYDDRELWDRINAVTIPKGKVVYGYANDDTHVIANLFRNYNFLLSPTITEADVRNTMINGATYFSRELGGSGNALAPRINNIVVDEKRKTVTINSDSENIKWITENTEEIGAGNTFNYSNFDKSFFRAEITNEYGITCTQPFAFVSSIPTKIKILTIDMKQTKVCDKGKFRSVISKIYINKEWTEFK